MKQKREEFKLNSHEINTQRSENLNNIESSPSHSNLKSESDINELHTDLTKNKLINIKIYKVWGLGIGDWGLGIGPNPQSPIPNPQSPYSNSFLRKKN
jgi:hypothetical protein